MTWNNIKQRLPAIPEIEMVDNDLAIFIVFSTKIGLLEALYNTKNNSFYYIENDFVIPDVVYWDVVYRPKEYHISYPEFKEPIF